MTPQELWELINARDYLHFGFGAYTWRVDVGHLGVWCYHLGCICLAGAGWTLFNLRRARP